MNPSSFWNIHLPISLVLGGLFSGQQASVQTKIFKSRDARIQEVLKNINIVCSTVFIIRMKK